MPLSIVRNDITRVAADAIVNSANPHPVVGRGVDSAIHAAAGPALLEARRRIGDIAVGDAAATSSGRLDARIVVHTVGPVWQGGTCGEIEAVESCYRRSLAVARRYGCASIAFPLISTGTYGFPKDRALATAMSTIKDELSRQDMDVLLVVYDPESFEISRQLASGVESYLLDNLVGGPASGGRAGYLESVDECSMDAAPMLDAPCASLPAAAPRSVRPQQLEKAKAAAPGTKSSAPGILQRLLHRKALSRDERSLEDVLAQAQESFSCALLRMIDERSLKDPEVYKRANIDRKLFSKIRSNPEYQPKKTTALALAIALELTLDETLDLLGRAGYTLSHANKADLIVEYCIENKVYDIYEVNALLFAFDQPTLGPRP